MRYRLSLFAVGLLVALCVSAYAVEIPSYSSPVTDLTGTLSAADKANIEDLILHYRDSTGNELGVLIVPSLDGRAIEDFAYDVFKKWGIGEKDKDNGALFVIAMQEHAARIEVGYGLEAEFTDLEAGRLVSKRSEMAQFFRAGDFAGGIRAVVSGMIEAIGGEYEPRQVAPSEDGRAKALSVVMFLIFMIPMLIFIIRMRRGGRHFGGPFIGGMMGGMMSGRGGGFSGGGGGGFSFGGGSSGGGGASGGW